MAKFLCIGIPARNEADSIGRTISSIVKSKAWKENSGANRELIVCVNGSKDGTAAIVRTLAKTIPEIKVLELKAPGKNRAINEIARASSRRADTIYYSDADVLVKRDTIGKTVTALRRDPKIEFAAPIVVPSSAFVNPSMRGPTSELYVEGSRIGRKHKAYRLTGMGFAVKKAFIKSHPLPIKRSHGDDRFINYAYRDKIKVIYDAVVVTRPPSLHDHMKQRVRHKRQKRALLQARPNLRAAAKAQGKEVSPRKLPLLREASPKALFGVVLNQFAEAWATVKAKGKPKEPWPRIKSTKLTKRRRK